MVPWKVGNTQSIAREEWNQLKPGNTGKLTLSVWQQYESRFKLSLQRLHVSPPSPDEQFKAIAKNLPEKTRMSLVKEMAKINERKIQVKITGLQGCSRGDIAHLVLGAIGKEPLEIIPDGVHFRVVVANDFDRKELCKKDKVTLQNGSKIRLYPFEDTMSTEDIFTFFWEAFGSSRSFACSCERFCLG